MRGGQCHFLDWKDCAAVKVRRLLGVLKAGYMFFNSGILLSAAFIAATLWLVSVAGIGVLIAQMFYSWLLWLAGKRIDPKVQPLHANFSPVLALSRNKQSHAIPRHFTKTNSIGRICL